MYNLTCLLCSSVSRSRPQTFLLSNMFTITLDPILPSSSPSPTPTLPSPTLPSPFLPSPFQPSPLFPQPTIPPFIPPSSPHIIIDDTNSAIQYTGPWFGVNTLNNTGSFGSPLQNTLHGVNENASFAFNFSGISRLLFIYTDFAFEPSHSNRRFQDRQSLFSGVTAHTKAIGPPNTQLGSVLSTMLLFPSIRMGRQLQICPTTGTFVLVSTVRFQMGPIHSP